jgi:hypothetical protein
MARRKTTFGELAYGEAFYFSWGRHPAYKGNPDRGAAEAGYDGVGICSGAALADGSPHVPMVPMRNDYPVYLDPPEPDDSLVPEVIR